MEWTFTALLAVGCLCTVLSAPSDEGYLIAYPLAFRPGVTERLSVTIFNSQDPIIVEARIRWRNETLGEVQETITGKGTLFMKVPDHVTGKAVLEVCGNCQMGAQGYHFQNASDITVLEESTSVFIQTDKPIYKPQQAVLINLFTTGPDLRPKDIPMLIYIVDPKGSRMIQWRNLKPSCCGIVNTSFPLSDQPVLGTWLIFVDVQGQIYNKTFTVDKYVLPRFEVVIDPPGFLRVSSKCSQAAVHAMYTFGQPVQGKLAINMNLYGTGYYNHYIGENNFFFMDINGTAYFDICLNALTSSPLKSHFKGVVRIEASVTSSDGSVFSAMDETCLVRKQLVSMEFSPDTKKHFKPGLPYYGKVLLWYPDDTPASNVEVQIHVEKDTESIFREEFVAVDGAVSFTIPSLPDGSGLLWLDATVVAVDGQTPGTSYYPYYLSLGSWYSPSDCHLLMTNQESGKLKVGSTARIRIQSTCPCNFSLHYEVMSRGNIVISGLHSPRAKRGAVPVFAGISADSHPVDVTNTSDSSSVTCETELSFVVTSSMAPSSRLLVYYLRPDGEGVVDNVQLEVEPSFENKVSVSWSRNMTAPKSHVSMLISAKPDSCVCVATVDKSVQLLRPGYQVTPEMVFAELAKYDLTEERYEDTFWLGSTFRRRKRSSQWNAMRLRDADYAFREAGLRVMTDKVQLRFQDFADDTEVLPRKDATQPTDGVDKRRRAYFPETWIFNCFNISSTRRDNYIQLEVPDTITTWQTDVVAMSQVHGLGVARSVPLTTFKDFFIEYTLPYSVIRGEQLRVPITVFNYMDVCVKARLSVSLQDGVKFISHGGRSHSVDLCLQARHTSTVHMELVFTELGHKRIHAGAEALMTMSCDCSDGPGLGDVLPTILAVDKITNNILVEPEGIARGYTYSVFFCPNERIHISTPNYDQYQFLHPPDGMEFFTFLCKATSTAKIALSRDQTDTIDYEIVLGGFDNTQSWISRGRAGPRLQTAITPGIVTWDEFRAFWVSWNQGKIQIGHGETKSNASVILTVADPRAVGLNVQYIGFATGSGSFGEFRIWKRKGNSEIYSEAFTLSLPLNFVPGSERAQVTVIADVMGPTLNNLHNLIRLPFGCGEQNMIHFAPNVYIMRYLQKTTQLTHVIKTEATGYLIQGYQRQLTYKRHDGSYSAFGENDSSGSMWLTAFVLKSFAQSRSFIYVDPREMRQSKSWIVSQQGPDGSFPPVGRVLNKDIQGGIQGKVSLTAYVVVALMEAGVDSDQERLSIIVAQKFLEDNVHPDAIRDPYTAALVAYALTLRKSEYAPTAERLLSNMAIRKDGQTYWRLSDQPLEALPFFAHLGNIKQTVTSAEVEMTAYALLTYTLLGDIAYSLPIVKWLTQQRNSLGGFSSTQDTCVALQALSEYATLAYVGHVNLNVTLAYTNLMNPIPVEEHFYLNNDNSKVLQVSEIPAMTQTLFIGAIGEGCGLMQVDMSYNIPDPTSKQAFKLNVKMSETPPPSENEMRSRRSASGAHHEQAGGGMAGSKDYKVTMDVCSRWLHAGSSNMAVVEVSLLTGFSADIESLERLILDRQSKLKRYEIDGRRVILYFDEISSQCMTCVTFDAYRNFVVGKLQAVPVKVYDYYEPYYEETRFYNVSSASPLARELCEDENPDCNNVEDQEQTGSKQQPVVHINIDTDDDLCNTVFSACHSPADQLRCGCQRACQYEPGSVVCGSNGVTYDNYCYMEVDSCQLELPIRALPLYMCPERGPVYVNSDAAASRLGGNRRPPKPGPRYIGPTLPPPDTTTHRRSSPIPHASTNGSHETNASQSRVPDDYPSSSSDSFSWVDEAVRGLKKDIGFGLGGSDFLDELPDFWDEEDEGIIEPDVEEDVEEDVMFELPTSDPGFIDVQDQTTVGQLTTEEAGLGESKDSPKDLDLDLDAGGFPNLGLNEPSSTLSPLTETSVLNTTSGNGSVVTHDQGTASFNRTTESMPTPVVLEQADLINMKEDFDLVQANPVLARTGQEQSRVETQDQPGSSSSQVVGNPVQTGLTQLQSGLLQAETEAAGEAAVQPVREFVKSLHRQDHLHDRHPHLPPEVISRSQIRRRRRGA